MSATASLESHLDSPADKPKPTLIPISDTDEFGIMDLILSVGFPSSSDITFKHVAHQHKQPSSLSEDGGHNWAEII